MLRAVSSAISQQKGNSAHEIPGLWMGLRGRGMVAGLGEARGGQGRSFGQEKGRRQGQCGRVQRPMLAGERSERSHRKQDREMAGEGTPHADSREPVGLCR